MVSEFTIHRAQELLRSIRILRQTLERRFAPDSAVDESVDSIELEATLLISQLKREK